MAVQAAKEGEGACVRLNAANEIAVELFIEGRIGFNQIPELIHYAPHQLGAS